MVLLVKESGVEKKNTPQKKPTELLHITDLFYHIMLYILLLYPIDIRVFVIS